MIRSIRVTRGPLPSSLETLNESKPNLSRNICNYAIRLDARALAHPFVLRDDVLPLRFHGDLACSVRLGRERCFHLYRSTWVEARAHRPVAERRGYVVRPQQSSFALCDPFQPFDL